MSENLKLLYYCEKCKKHNEVMKNKKLCFECYTKQLKYCEICRRSYIGYENHMKLHNVKETGNLITDILNVISSPGSQFCKYCKRTVDETNYYFSIKKCKECH